MRNFFYFVCFIFLMMLWASVSYYCVSEHFKCESSASIIDNSIQTDDWKVCPEKYIFKGNEYEHLDGYDRLVDDYQLCFYGADCKTMRLQDSYRDQQGNKRYFCGEQWKDQDVKMCLLQDGLYMKRFPNGKNIVQRLCCPESNISEDCWKIVSIADKNNCTSHYQRYPFKKNHILSQDLFHYTTDKCLVEK